MEKIIIRTKITSNISYATIQEQKENENIENMMDRLGEIELLNKIFGESEETCSCIFKEYDNMKKCREGSYFSWMYVLDSQYGAARPATRNMRRM